MWDKSEEGEEEFLDSLWVHIVNGCVTIDVTEEGERVDWILEPAVFTILN